MHARSAILPDAAEVRSLIDRYVADGTLLPRSLPEICENIRDFVVVEHDGVLAGCGALHLYGPHLAEVRSLAVRPELQRRGVGRLIVNTLLAEAGRQRVACVCLFTRIPAFFSALGFASAERYVLPEKVYKDCRLCPRRHACDEITMFRGALPATVTAAAPASRRSLTLSALE